MPTNADHWAELVNKRRAELETADQLYERAREKGAHHLEKYVANVNYFRRELEEAEYQLARARFGSPPIEDE